MTEEVNRDLFPYEPVESELFPVLEERAAEREIYDLLTSISNRGVSLRWEAATDRLIANPGSRLNGKHKEMLAKHKARIVAAMKEWKRREEDRVYQRTGVIQCERQVFDIAKERLR